jgi:hypothetical protein
MRHKLYLFFVLTFAGISLKAQYVGPGKPEIKKLKGLLATGGAAGANEADGAEVKKLYADFQRLADQSLSEEPHPIDTIRTEGLLQGNPKKTATREALNDMGKMYALALVYRVSGDGKYLEKVTAYLKAWATQNTPNGDPIDDTNLDGAIEAYDMIKGSLAPADAAVVQAWLKRTAEVEISSRYNAPNRATATNNWNSHRLKIIGEIAFTIGDTTLKSYTINGLERQVEINLGPDGPSKDFISRDALHYHVYDLEPLLKLSIVLQRATGVNYYTWQSPSTSSIKKSVDWLLPYLDGQKTHPEFVNSTVDFDRRRAQNGEASYKAGTLFEPKNGIHTLLLAALFDESLLPPARKLSGRDDRFPGWQSVVNFLSK